jgi:hypothetical protein
MYGDVFGMGNGQLGPGLHDAGGEIDKKNCTLTQYVTNV